MREWIKVNHAGMFWVSTGSPGSGILSGNTKSCCKQYNCAIEHRRNGNETNLEFVKIFVYRRLDVLQELIAGLVNGENRVMGKARRCFKY